MDIVKFKSTLSEQVIAPMLSYREECGEACDFTEKDVRKCEKILAEYLETLAKSASPSDKAIRSAVKKAVLALNKLNEKTDYALLETDERETICELMQMAAEEAGLQVGDEDITEEWREW